MRLRLIKDSVGICTRSKERYYRNGNGVWEKAVFDSVDDLTKNRLAEVGIDVEESYRGFIDEIKTQPPDKLLKDLSMVPVYSLTEVNSMSVSSDPRLWGWKKGSRGNRHRRIN